MSMIKIGVKEVISVEPLHGYKITVKDDVFGDIRTIKVAGEDLNELMSTIYTTTFWEEPA